jgi:hypothetical protein
MNTKRFLLVVGLLSMLFVAMTISNPGPTVYLASEQGANDIYQRHPERRNGMNNAVVPVTGISEMSDYYQRHPELRVPEDVRVDRTDYFMRHPELRTSFPVNLSDYFQRHPELRLP